MDVITEDGGSLMIKLDRATRQSSTKEYPVNLNQTLYTNYLNLNSNCERRERHHNDLKIDPYRHN